MSRRIFFSILIIFISVIYCTFVCGKRFGGDGPFLKLDELENLPTKVFFETFVKNKKAVVLKNGCKSFPAKNLWQSDDYLLQASRGYHDIKFTVETVKKESRNQPILG